MLPPLIPTQTSVSLCPSLSLKKKAIISKAEGDGIARLQVMRGGGLTERRPSLAPPIPPRHRRFVGDNGLLDAEEDPFAVEGAAVGDLDGGGVCSRGC